jgi:hypothetical protein
MDPVGHLLRQPPIEVMEFLIGALIRFHHLRPHQMLRKHDVVDVVLYGLFQQIPLRLAVFLSDHHEFSIKLGVDGGPIFTVDLLLMPN